MRCLLRFIKFNGRWINSCWYSLIRNGWLQSRWAKGGRLFLFRLLLFIGALAIALLSNSLAPTLFPSAQSTVAIAQVAQSPDQQPDQLVEAGAEAYRLGDYRAAIAFWQQALAAYPADASPERAFINENLARAAQKVGETAITLDYWAAAADAYQATGNLRQFGRALTEQAQVYIGRGQHQRAAALLCGPSPQTDYIQVGNVRIKQPQQPLEQIEQASAAIGDSDPSQPKLCTGGSYVIAQEINDAKGQAAALGSLAETNRLSGRYETAEAMLKAGLDYVSRHLLSQYEAPMLNSLGDIYIRQSQVALRRAESARLIGANVDITRKLQNEARRYRQTAFSTLNRAVQSAVDTKDVAAELSAQVNLLLLQQQLRELPVSISQASTRQRLRQLIKQLPPSRETSYAAIALAKSYQETTGDFICQRIDQLSVQQNLIQQNSIEQDLTGQNSIEQDLTDQNSTEQDLKKQYWLETARRLAEDIQDARAASFALGELGHLAECQGRLEDAVHLTQQAQLSAGLTLESADSLYLWEWQIGRLYWQQGDLVTATAAYQRAIDTLEVIRTDILTADRELQFDFRDTVEPIYRQYVELQLATWPESLNSKLSDAATSSQASSQMIDLPEFWAKQALQTIDNLRLAELQNFFGDDCVLSPSADVSEQLFSTDSHTAAISSIVLSNQVVLIATIPNQPTKAILIGELESLKQDVQAFQAKLKRFADLNYDKTLSQQLYQKLLGQLQAVLEDADIRTLVFVQDGFLRNIPMAALHDGERYLIERYAIATTPSLQLTAAPAARKPVFRALAVGLSEETTIANGQKFAKLDSVPDELASVAEQLPNSTVLLNQGFTKATLTSALETSPYAILHLATHGQFSTIPEETFVVTGTANMGSADTLTFGELEALIRPASPNAEPVDLITLTACETATGDDRATLGLAGVAIRAGARSAIASLWKISDDTAATLTDQFYRYLKQPQITKAQALQLAQMAVINEDPEAHPGTWAPLLLVGSWE